MKCLLQYDWPGNVRELENCIERAVALGDHKTVDLGDLPPTIASASPSAETAGRNQHWPCFFHGFGGH